MVKISEYNNLFDFITYIKDKSKIDDILNEYNTQSEKGFVYERLWDLVIKFGFCPLFPNSRFEHITSNINTGKPKKMSNLHTYLSNNKVSSGNSGGCSDITLFNPEQEQFIFISSKYPKCDDDNEKIKNKSVDYYDIQNILAVIKDNENIYQNYDIYLLVPNKINVFNAIKQSNKSSSYITKHMKNILDKNDLQIYYNDFIESIKKYEFNEFNDIYGKKKDNLKFFFHQELIIKKTAEKIEEGEKQFLWGCKCRSGKTYMTGGIILNQQQLKKIINVLIITPAPTETAPQFTEDLFNSFSDFSFFDVHHIKDSNYLKNLKVNKEKSNIYVASKQLLQKYTNENKNKELSNFDIIIFDENHFSGTTEKSKDILKTYSNKYTIKIYLTATYNKPLKEWNIKEDCQFYWDIEDEQICKLICSDDKEIKQKEVNRLLEKHGDMVATIINDKRSKGYKTNDIFNSYLNMPDLCLLTSMFDQQRYEILKTEISDSVYGFSFDALFSMNKQKTKFQYEDQVKKFFRFVSGSNKNKDFTNGDKSIFTRINNICSNRETRTPFTQIWFLPPNNINETSKALKNLLLEDKILCEYDVYSINSKNEDLQNDIKEEINKMETNAIKNEKRGLILLAGNMLGLGITLKNCDVVMLLNNTLSSDKVMQQMYRCMTEGYKKKIGFVIDLNIGRVLNTCLNYSVYNNSHNLEEKIRYLIEYHLINIDVDYFDNKKINSDTLVEKLMNIWKDNPINNLRTLLRNLDNEFIEFDNETQKLLNKSFTSSTKGDIKATLEVKDEEDELQSLKSGKVKSSEKEETEKNELDKELDEIEKAEKEISFTKDVLPYVIPLACILTMKETNKDFINMLSYIKNNPELLEIFDEQSLVWWNKKDLINIISEITKKYINKESNTFNISVNFKMGLQSLIDKPKELLELINECLKPKETEKKQFGEVFTPMTLVNEMLDKLPKEVWANKNLKWLDPCVGMGNFMISVYLRLMESLKKELPDDKKRKKHILENMLYMCELNKKNCYIVKQIFNINNEYKINIYEGDFLNFDSKKRFKVEQFDIIIGNPPYQDGSGNKGKGHTLWTKFVEKSINVLLKENGYLVYVHPSLWRQAEHEMLELMKSKQIIYLEIHDEKDGQKTFKCSTRYDWYVLQNKNNTQKTIIKGQNNKIYNVDLNIWSFVPNYDFDIIEKMINSNKKINVLSSRSAYGHDKKWVQKNKNDEYKYPVVYSVNKQNQLTLHYSSKNDNGHFNIPKVIFGSGATGFIIDKKGDYGLTQWAVGIIDDIENLELIKNALESEKFKDIIKAISVSKAEINPKILKYFNKDFYKFFDKKEIEEPKKVMSKSIKKVK